MVNQTFAAQALPVLYDGEPPSSFKVKFSPDATKAGSPAGRLRAERHDNGHHHAGRGHWQAPLTTSANGSLQSRLRGSSLASESESAALAKRSPTLSGLPDPDNFINSTVSAQLLHPWTSPDGTVHAQLVIRAVNVYNANATVLLDVRGLTNVSGAVAREAAHRQYKHWQRREQLQPAESTPYDAHHDAEPWNLTDRTSPGSPADSESNPEPQAAGVFAASGERWLLVGGNPYTWNTPAQPTVRDCDMTAVQSAKNS